MIETHSAEQPSARIKDALKRIRDEMPASANVIDAFEELLVQQFTLQAELPTPELGNTEVALAEFSQGRPILGLEAFSISWDELKQAGSRLIPAMMRGFPGLSEQLSAIERAIENQTLTTGNRLNGTFAFGKLEQAENDSYPGINPEILQFVLMQLLKPFAAKKAECMGTLIGDQAWIRGYCPICGSWPEIGFLEGSEGRRRLRCSSCGHEWTFSRTKCPFCESATSGKVEIFYSEDRPFERVELCHNCMKYLVSIDLRARGTELVRDVAALGLVYLDILAQERGFSPGASVGWNQVGGND